MPVSISFTVKRLWLVPGLLFLTSCLVSQKFLDPVNWPKQIGLLAITPYLAYLATSHNLHPRRTLRAGFTCYLITITLVSIPSIVTSENLTRTIWGTWGRNNGLLTQILLFSIAFIVFLLSSNSIFPKILVSGISFFFIPAVIYGYVQYFGFDPFDWSQKNQIFSFFGNTNFAAAIFSLSATATLAILAQEKRIDRKLMLIGLLCAILFILINTDSIQGIVSFLVGAMSLVIGMWKAKRKKLKNLVLMSLILSSVPVVNGILGRGPLDFLYQYTFYLRTFYWKIGLKMGLENPLVGVGVDSYGDFYRGARPIEVIRLTTMDLTTNNAHNTLIQIFATLGILGLVATLIFVLPATYFSVREIIGESNDPWKVACSALLLQFLAISTISIDNIAVAIIGYSVIGLAFNFFLKSKITVAETKSREVVRKGNPVKFDWARTVSVFLLTPLFFGFAWLGSFSDRQLAKEFRSSLAISDTVGINQRLEIFKLLDSKTPFVQEQQFQYMIAFAQSTQQDSAALDLAELALGHFPKDFGLLDRASVIAEKLGRFELASQLRLRQVNLDPNHPLVRIYYARSLFELGKIEEANFQLAKASQTEEFLSDAGRQYRDLLKDTINQIP